MSERFISVNPDNMELGKFYNVFTDKDNATLLIKKDVQDAINADVGTLKTTQNELVLDMTNAKDDINNLEANFTNLNTNISNLGTDVNNLEVDINSLQSDNTTNKTNITNLQNDNTTNKSDISSLKSDNTTNKSNISSLQSDNTTNKSDISTLKTDNTTNKSNINTLQSNVNTLQSDIVNLKTPISQCWVSSNGNDNNSGSMSFPLRTIQKALNESFGQINILSGTYTENITIPVGYGVYGPVISGIGTFESPKSEIHGTITIPAGVSRLRIKNMQLDGNLAGPAIIDNNSEGRHVLENCTVSHPATNGDLIRIVNGKNWWNVEGSTIEGIINLSGIGNNMTFNIINSPNSYLCLPTINNGYTFTAFNVNKIGAITHNGGNVFCSYVRSWQPTTGKIITSTSTSPTDIIGVGYSSFTADLVNYGTISTAGATVIKNYNAEFPYNDVCLSVVSIVPTTLITTTPSTLIAGTKKVERNISYNITNGELTFVKTGSYIITLVIKIDSTEWNKKVETWIEKYNTSTATWDIVADTGFQRNFQTDQEVEVNYHFASYFIAGEKYRLRAVSDSDTTISAKTITLTNGTKMPAIRISVYSNS